MNGKPEEYSPSRLYNLIFVRTATADMRDRFGLAGSCIIIFTFYIVNIVIWEKSTKTKVNDLEIILCQHRVMRNLSDITRTENTKYKDSIIKAKMKYL